MAKFAAIARSLALAGVGLAFVASSAAHAEDASIAQRLTERGIKYEVDGDGDFKVTYNYKKEGRTQLVFVAGRTHTVGGWVIREVFAPAAKVTEDGIDGARALELLRDSSTYKFGSWEIRGNVLYFVGKFSDGIDAAQLEAVMDTIAESADDGEIKISGSRDSY